MDTMTTPGGVGGAATAYSLADRVVRDDGTVLMTGVQALARIPVEQLRVDRLAGHRTAAFASGYPGSPLAGLDLELQRTARLAPELPIVVRPALNEELGVSAVMGSQLASERPDARYDGVVGLWYGKAPGLDRASDALRHAVFAGTAPLGGAVAVVGDDPEAKSSTLPSSSDATFCDLHLPILYPADVAEALDLGRHAIALSRASGLWVGLKVVSAVADGSGTVALDPNRVRPVMPTLDGGEPYRCRPDGALLGAHSLQLEEELRGVRTELAVAYGTVNGLNRVTVPARDAWLGIMASGLTYRELRSALHRLGLDEARLGASGVRILQMQMPIPFDPDVVRRFALGLEELMVVEEMNPTLERLVRDALYDRADRPVVTGKRDRTGGPQFPSSGPLYADAILGPLRRALEGRLGERLAPVPADRERIRIPLSESRTPFFCSGCPHNRSTRVPEGTLVGAGIGCHTMVMLGDDQRLGEILCVSAMGNEGAPWIGMSEFVGTGHFTQNLGDGTYFHSGQLAVQAAVAAGVDITFKLLFNGHVAMTGGQLPPGRREVPAVVTALLAQGVSRVVVTTDDPRRLRPGCPRGRGARPVADHRHPGGAGGHAGGHRDAPRPGVRSRAPAGPATRPARDARAPDRHQRGHLRGLRRLLRAQLVPVGAAGRHAPGRATRIDQAGCNLDLSCIEGDCPSFALVRPARSGWLGRLAGRWARRRPHPPNDGAVVGTPSAPEPPTDLPEPPRGPLGAGATVRVRMAGVGGTGVVTASQVVATAALLDGTAVRGLDQTGLSQKAGPVVSDLCLGGQDGAFGSNHLGAGQADLLVAFDGLVAAADGPLGAASPQRTHLVASTTVTPTASMVLNPGLHTAEPEVVQRRLRAACVPPGWFVDAGAVAALLVGDPSVANMVLVGVGVQSGLLPVSAGAVGEAIGLNGVAVAENAAAFAWGRAAVAEPEVLAAALARARSAATGGAVFEGAPQREGVVAETARGLAALGVPEGTVEGFVRRAADLVGYQGEGLAVEHARRVLTAAERELAVAPGTWELTAAVDSQVHRVLAYKDEYEVARLLRTPEARLAAEQVAGGPARVTWLLHPPALRSLGLQRKLPVSARVGPAMAVLARGRRLRAHGGTPSGGARSAGPNAHSPRPTAGSSTRCWPGSTGPTTASPWSW